jgi:hypothetical protein
MGNESMDTGSAFDFPFFISHFSFSIFWAMRGPAVAKEARFLEMKNDKWKIQTD